MRSRKWICRANRTVVADPDDGVWVSLWGSNQIARVSGDGSDVVTIDLPPGSEPHGLAIGPDGAPWIALESGFVLRMPRLTGHWQCTHQFSHTRPKLSLTPGRPPSSSLLIVTAGFNGDSGSIAGGRGGGAGSGCAPAAPAPAMNAAVVKQPAISP
jgi:DNA-binding beta-propeller fold protein YncE